jgi:hypothetical protein
MHSEHYSIDGVGGTDCPLTTPRVRQLPTPILVALDVVGGLKVPPFVSNDRNGRGGSYQRLRYRPAGGKWHGIYLGNLSPSDEAWFRHELARRWPIKPNEYFRQVRRLRSNRGHLRRVAQDIAAQIGCRFWGWRLCRKQGVKRIDDSCANVLLQTLEALQATNVGLVAYYVARLGGRAGTVGLRPYWYGRTLGALKAVYSAHAKTEQSLRRLTRWSAT